MEDDDVVGLNSVHPEVVKFIAVKYKDALTKKSAKI